MRKKIVHRGFEWIFKKKKEKEKLLICDHSNHFPAQDRFAFAPLISMYSLLYVFNNITLLTLPLSLCLHVCLSVCLSLFLPLDPQARRRLLQQRQVCVHAFIQSPFLLLLFFLLHSALSDSCSSARSVEWQRPVISRAAWMHVGHAIASNDLLLPRMKELLHLEQF